MRMIQLIIFTVLFSPLLSFADVPDYQGEVSPGSFDITRENIYCQTFSEQESSEVEKVCLDQVDIKYRLYAMMGEPVGDYKVAWTIHPYLYLHGSGKSGKISEMPPSVQKAFRNLIPIAPTKFAIYSFASGVYRTYFPFDAGTMKRSGEGYSFNTPGSPSWDHFIARVDGFDFFYDETDAKEHFKNIDKNGFRFFSIKDLTFSGISELNAAILKEKSKPQEQVDELEAALAETEQETAGEDDFFPNETIAGEKSFEEMLEDSEKINLTINEIPRTTNSNVITARGRVENASSIDSSEIVFNINGLEQHVYLANDGSFSNKVVLFNGENNIDINYKSASKSAQKTIHVTSSTPPVKARFTLTWDRGGSDMDLHAYGPDGDHCFYESKMTENMQLDVDNRSGYGPENISVKLNQHPGTYQIYIKHFGGQAANVTLYVYLDNRLVATKQAHLSGNQKWNAYNLNIH